MVRLQGASKGAYSLYVTFDATPKTVQKTSKIVEFISSGALSGSRRKNSGRRRANAAPRGICHTYIEDGLLRVTAENPVHQDVHLTALISLTVRAAAAPLLAVPDGEATLKRPPMISRATLVLANHRPETVPVAQLLMGRHDTVVLEEPPDPHFLPMLNGQVSIGAYLETQDLEYPEFSRRMAGILRDLHRAGTRLFQIEPFIDHLLAIHDRFADGQGPSDLPEGTLLHTVYQAERTATGALLDFYSVSTSGTFEATVKAVKRFARADAMRFALRDRLRAQAMIDVIKAPGSTYIEAGQIHYPIWRELRQRLPADYPMRVHFLMTDAVRSMGYRGHLYGPGDLLTLLYRFHPGAFPEGRSSRSPGADLQQIDRQGRNSRGQCSLCTYPR